MGEKVTEEENLNMNVLLLFPKHLLLVMSKAEWWLSWLFGLTQYVCVHAKELHLFKVFLPYAL